MNEENKTIDVVEEESSIDFGKIFKDLLQHKRLYFIVLPVAFVLAAIYALSLPNYYSCSVKLSPELGGSSRSAGSLASLASSFGVNLGSASTSGADALLPTLYPDLMNSVDFKTALFPVKVTREEDGQSFTYYDYLMNSAKKNKVVPIAWDTGHEGENNMTIIRRQSEPDGSVFDVEVLNLMRKAYGLGDYVNKGITHVEDFVEGTTDIIEAETFRRGMAKWNAPNLRRDGLRLLADGTIKLFDINGNLLRSGSSEISLQGLRQGIYIAKSGNSLLKVNLQ